MLATIVNSVEARAFSARGDKLRIVHFPVEVKLSPRANRGRVEVRIEYDERLFSPPATAGVSVGDGEVLPLKPVQIETGVISLSVPSAAEGLYIPAQVRHAYPDELIDEVNATRLLIDGVTLLLDSSAQEVSAWGVELSALWAVAKATSFPAGIELHSVGPHSAPSGLALRLTTAAPLGKLNTDNGQQVTSTTSDSRLQSFLFDVGDAIPAGETRSMSFTHPDEEWQMPEAVMVTRVELIAPSEALAGMRETAAISLAAVDTSGGPLSDYSDNRKA